MLHSLLLGIYCRRFVCSIHKTDAFEGTVECDEVYIGGKEKWKHKSMRTPHTQGRSTKTKTPVFGMMERSTIINANGEIENVTIREAKTS